MEINFPGHFAVAVSQTAGNSFKGNTLFRQQGDMGVPEGVRCKFAAEQRSGVLCKILLISPIAIAGWRKYFSVPFDKSFGSGSRLKFPTEWKKFILNENITG